MSIVFLDDETLTLGDVDFSPLSRLAGYTAYPDTGEESDVIERAAGAEVIVVNKAPVSRRVLERLEALKLVAVIATGTNNVDIEAARQRGVRVCNVTGYAADTVPQHAFALILNLATQAYRYHADVKAGDWGRAPTFTLLKYPTFELAGKTIGIVGFGSIGRGVARIAEAFGMTVLVHDPVGEPDAAYPSVDLDALLPEADVVTLHCPLTDQTHNLIDAPELAKMKRGALIVNTARGGIINERALADALAGGRIAGAGIDVLSEEPPVEGNVLLDADNIILTPHSAWSTVEARQRLVDETARNIEAFLRGELRNVVV